MALESSGDNGPDIPEELEDAIRNRRCILLTGCGLSAQIQSEEGNLPASWRDCLYSIVDWCISQKRIQEQEEEEAILALIDEGHLSAAGNLLEDKYLKDPLSRWECLNQILSHESVLAQPSISRLHDLIVQIRFRAYFATNYDTFLEQAFVNIQKKPLERIYENSIEDAVKAYGKYLESKQPFILKLHGDVKKPDSLLLGDRDFKRLGEDNHSSYKDGLKQLLLASSILCVGFEETDHDMAYLLAEAGIESKTHFNRRNKYWSLVVQTGQNAGDHDAQDERINIIRCHSEGIVAFFERLLANLQSHSSPKTRNEYNSGGRGTNGQHQENPQLEQVISSQTDSSLNSTNVYVSYDEADKELWEKLDKQLESMKEWIAVQNRTKVRYGKDEKIEIRNLILQAHILLLMISPDFTTSEMCQYEVEEAMKRYPELRIIPIYLRPVDWRNKPYGKLKPLPENGIPVSQARDKDETFSCIATAIKEEVEELRQPQKS